jgi:Tfp pilus assembly protein PilX
MTRSLSNERGAAMVLVLGVLAALAVLALVVMRIVMSEKRTQFTDYTNNRSFYSADAAGEAGVAWIRRQPSPPSLVDTLSHVSVSNAYTALSNDHLYKYDVRFVRKKFRPGWSVEYKDYEYLVEASGVSAQQAESAVELGATRLFREGY